MSKRHQASRRRSYGPRRHDSVERHGRDVDVMSPRPEHDGLVSAADSRGVDLAGFAPASVEQLASYGPWPELRMGLGD